ncbi:MAG: NERD domain-containing protein [Promethearchaeota archaeon]
MTREKDFLNFVFRLKNYIINYRGNYEEIYVEKSNFFKIFKISSEFLKEIIYNFSFLKENNSFYTEYIIIDKISFILEAKRYLNITFKDLCESLKFNEFEALISKIMEKNGYFSIKNFRFTSKIPDISKQRRFEIDIIALNHKYFLLIDAKRWRRRDPFSSLNKAANLQLKRTYALINNSQLISDLIIKLKGGRKGNFPGNRLKIIPLIVTLEDSSFLINQKGVPLVSIDRLNNFLYELNEFGDKFLIINYDLL